MNQPLYIGMSWTPNELCLEAKETDEPKGSTWNAGRNVASHWKGENEKLNVAILYLKN